MCNAGEPSCTLSAKAISVCSSEGDSFELNPCGSGRSCSVANGSAECRKAVCEAGTWVCDDANETAQLCSANGLEIARSVSCADDGKVCDAGECFAKVCEPGTKRCDNDALVVCNASGAAEATIACADDERCDETTTECIAKTCEPTSLGCIEETIAICDASGSGYEASGEDCAASLLACWQGSCRPIVCSPGSSCVDGDSYECASNRTELTLSEHCSAENGQFCNGETGACQEYVCEPGLPTCNEDLATSCADDGSHALDFGVDCTATAKVCWAAECLAPICEPDSYDCDGPNLRRCVHKGTAHEAVKVCGEGTVCDANAGSCRVQKCVPDQPACDGQVATTCDSTGLGYVGASQDCSASEKVCVAGECTAVICPPQATYCDGSELRHCGPNGGAFELLDTCLQSEFCDAARALCAADLCTAGAAVCVGQVLTKCADDGSGPTEGGINCAVNQMACDRGACRDLVCAPNARFCAAGDVALCNAAGTSSAPYDNCRSAEFCDATVSGAAVCGPDVCPQEGSGCSGEHLALCNADGSGFASTGVDCSSTANVCDLSGSCLATALDGPQESGAAVPAAGSAIHFELFRVLTSRKLVKLEAALTPDVAGNVSWLVYRSEAELGTYTLVDQATSDGSVNAGYVSSGALAIALQQNAYYLLGVAVKGSHATLVREGAAPKPVSFGQLLGGFTYNAGLVPTIPSQLQVDGALLSDDVTLRVSTASP